MIIIAAVALATLLASFACSLFEAVLDALSPTDVEAIRQTKAFGAERLGVLFANHQASRAAIVAIHTFAQILGSIFCGATVVYFHYGVPALIGFALGFAVLMLFFGHILPQSLGAAHGYDMARWTAWPIQLMLWSVWPLVAVSRKIMVALIGSGDNFVPTQDEIMEMSRLAGQGGELRPQEVRLVENSLKLDEVRVYDLMTPRTVVYTLPADLPLSAVKERSEHWVHSRLPLTEDREPDRILGMIHRRDVFDALVKGNRNLKLRDLMRPIDFVPDTMRGHQLLDKFVKEKKHMAVVIDEYGGFEGVVTLEDVLECLLGAEIVDEHDRYPDMQQLARQRAQEKVQRQDAEASALAAESSAATQDMPTLTKDGPTRTD